MDQKVDHVNMVFLSGKEHGKNTKTILIITKVDIELIYRI